MTGKTLSHYRILDKLGEGGMGVVYKAEDTRLKRTVALKLLPRELTLDPDAKERFSREAQAASGLDHPNICTIHEIDETEDGQMFMCMACYSGETLRQKIQRGPLPLEEALDVATQIAEGLKEAHQRGIIHRDIKPANVMVTPDGRVKIMDFGLAKLAGQPKLTRIGSTVGTVAYMSPEQARGLEVDHRTDIWSFGAVLYEMLTGSMPFKGTHEQTVIHSILNDEPEPVANLRADVPVQLISIVKRALAPLPGSRYCDMEVVLRDLRGIGEVEDPSAATVEIRTSKSPPSIAVLPFSNMSTDPEQEYFCDGMAEEIINALVQVKGVHVVARTSAFAFKNRCEDIRDIGKTLNVETVLEGSVRKAGSRLRITAQLIKVEDGYHLWSERYDRELEDVFAIQDEIARSIVEALEVKLSGREESVLKARPTENMDAYQAYLRGLEYAGRPDYSEEDFRLAVQMFERAMDLDPEFALAHTGLSIAYSALYFHGHDRTEASPTLAKAAADRALELQPTLPEAHLALGYYHYWCRQDFSQALAEFAIAERDLHDDARILAVVAAILKRQGKMDQTVEHYKRAFELSPQDASLPHEIGCALMTIRDYSQAELYYDRSIALAPDQTLAYICAAWNHWLWKGDMDGARRTLEAIPDRARQGGYRSSVARFERFRLELIARDYQKALDVLAPAPSAFVERQWWFIPKAQLEAFTYRLMGNEGRARDRYEAALAVLKGEAEQRPSDDRVRASLGVALAGLGRKEEAIQEGKLAVELMPVSKNAVVGPYRVEDLAFVYALVGEHEKAIDQLEYLLSIPFWNSVRMLSIDPRWDALREHPGFRELLTDLKGHQGCLDSATVQRECEAHDSQPTIAVMPFADMSPDKDQEYFCDGMAEEIINALTGVDGLRVIARTSAFAFKGKDEDIREIGRKLSAGTLLEGSVRKAGSRLRVTAQLINVADGCHLWSERYERELEDVFAVQDEIALAIVDKLKLGLIGEDAFAGGRRRTKDLKAYNLYLKGRYHWNKRTPEEVRKGLECFREAVERDPDYGPAYVGIADCCIILENLGELAPKEAYHEADAAVKSALEIDDGVAEAHATLGWIKMDRDHDWDAGEREFLRAIELDPGYATARHWYSLYLAAVNRQEEALEQIELAQQLDPLSPMIGTLVAYMLAGLGRHDQAIEQLERTLQMDPRFGIAHVQLAALYARKGMRDEALAEIERVVSLPMGERQRLVAQAYALTVVGKKDEALKLVGDLKGAAGEGVAPRNVMAAIHTALGEKDRAFELLDQVFEARSSAIFQVLTESAFEDLRSDPRFLALRRKAGLKT